VRFDVALFELQLCKSRSAASVAIQNGEDIPCAEGLQSRRP
jgi:predicted rRNA methylase YqxC with S4 and FtsJ domains